MERIPVEIQIKILEFLPWQELAKTMTRVNKHFRNLSLDCLGRVDFEGTFSETGFCLTEEAHCLRDIAQELGSEKLKCIEQMDLDFRFNSKTKKFRPKDWKLIPFLRLALETLPNLWMVKINCQPTNQATNYSFPPELLFEISKMVEEILESCDKREFRVLIDSDRRPNLTQFRIERNMKV